VVRADDMVPWPEARTSHASCVYEDTMYVHGGSTLNESKQADTLW